jgi:hypothetical protein
MTDNYTPKVGDKVRATLGENVLVGEVDHTNHTNHGGEFRIVVNGWATVWFNRSWHFEQVVDVPTKPFAVVAIDTNRAFFVRTGTDDWMNTYNGSSASDSTIRGLIRDEGYRVVFEGVEL